VLASRPIVAEPAVLPRPLRLKTAFVTRSYLTAAALGAAGAALLIGVLIWQAFEARGILADDALARSGVEASDVSVEGSRTSRNFILNSYKLDVRYTDRAGAAHQGVATFDTLFSSVTREEPVYVRYDARSSDRFVLSWAVQHPRGRWGALAMFVATAIGLGLGSLAWARELLRRLEEARQATVESDDVEIELSQVVRMKEHGRSTGVVSYQYFVTVASGKSKRRQVSFNRRKRHTPIFVDAGKTRVLAVRTRGAPDRPIVLRSDFYPFDVPEWDRQAALDRLARRSQS
jgi:hypothetical protein